MKPKEYEPARPDHIYNGEQVAIRKLYSEIVKKQSHNLNVDDFD